MNLNHFCDPEANAYPPDAKGEITAFNPYKRRWEKIKREFPIHDQCGGKAVINFGLETEMIVWCECECHDMVIVP
jgi:hypothetical protein